ncbi:MAG: hypothetical protein KTR21_00160, partial [Rhodobacteraceae bacterium]|nr:hypothetical protein [Paracoccaceae bacterium]
LFATARLEILRETENGFLAKFTVVQEKKVRKPLGGYAAVRSGVLALSFELDQDGYPLRALEWQPVLDRVLKSAPEYQSEAARTVRDRFRGMSDQEAAWFFGGMIHYWAAYHNFALIPGETYAEVDRQSSLITGTPVHRQREVKLLGVSNGVATIEERVVMPTADVAEFARDLLLADKGAPEEEVLRGIEEASMTSLNTYQVDLATGLTQMAEIASTVRGADGRVWMDIRRVHAWRLRD